MQLLSEYVHIDVLLLFCSCTFSIHARTDQDLVYKFQYNAILNVTVPLPVV